MSGEKLAAIELEHRLANAEAKLTATQAMAKELAQSIENYCNANRVNENNIDGSNEDQFYKVITKWAEFEKGE